jgi:hypothetical protein
MEFVGGVAAGSRYCTSTRLWVGFNIRIMVAETLMTGMSKQVEDSQAVDTAQLQ